MSLFADGTIEGGVPLVLLHGFGGSHAAWARVRAALPEGAATLAYDLPGHGRSFEAPGAGSPRKIAQALLADLDERGAKRVHLAGHSMGGAVATLMAMAAPERVASLTLLAPGGFGARINHRLLTRFAAAADAVAVETCLEAMTGWYSTVMPETVGHTLAERSGPRRLEKLAEIAEGLARDGRQGQLPQEALAALPMPVTLVWGELDNVLPAAQSRGVPSSFALHLFPDLGHMLPDEAPEEMAAIIARTAGLS